MLRCKHEPQSRRVLNGESNVKHYDVAESKAVSIPSGRWPIPPLRAYGPDLSCAPGERAPVPCPTGTHSPSPTAAPPGGLRGPQGSTSSRSTRTHSPSPTAALQVRAKNRNSKKAGWPARDGARFRKTLARPWARVSIDRKPTVVSDLRAHRRLAHRPTGGTSSQSS